MKYADKLKHPKWQKKRLEVLNDKGWKCEACGTDDKMLHVHHDKYKGNPWDISNEHLFVLCEFCHNCVHNIKINKNKHITADQYISMWNTSRFKFLLYSFKMYYTDTGIVQNTEDSFYYFMKMALLFNSLCEEGGNLE